ncbi:hypothetical protein X551_04716 [Methylibium sp. T29]|nr:hypothetical protein X551_04716 [Methylibium sp. T29]
MLHLAGADLVDVLLEVGPGEGLGIVHGLLTQGEVQIPVGLDGASLGLHAALPGFSLLSVQDGRPVGVAQAAPGRRAHLAGLLDLQQRGAVVLLLVVAARGLGVGVAAHDFGLQQLLVLALVVLLDQLHRFAQRQLAGHDLVRLVLRLHQHVGLIDHLQQCRELLGGHHGHERRLAQTGRVLAGHRERRGVRDAALGVLAHLLAFEHGQLVAVVDLRHLLGDQIQRLRGIDLRGGGAFAEGRSEGLATVARAGIGLELDRLGEHALTQTGEALLEDACFVVAARGLEQLRFESLEVLQRLGGVVLGAGGIELGPPVDLGARPLELRIGDLLGSADLGLLEVGLSVGVRSVRHAAHQAAGVDWRDATASNTLKCRGKLGLDDGNLRHGRS